jgi:crotonobetainyl-CoA:carnitine CoA-transferase CaiB-like acyl-CoA transferase
LEGELSAWFGARTTREAVDYLSGFSIPCAPVNTVEQAAKEPHLHEREIMVEVPDPIAGTMYVTGKMVKFSRTPMVVGSTPTVGEHTESILRDVLGYSQAKIKALEDETVVGSAGESVATT